LLTESMCWPHPAQVVLPQVLQVTARHIVLLLDCALIQGWLDDSGEGEEELLELFDGERIVSRRGRLGVVEAVLHGRGHDEEAGAIERRRHGRQLRDDVPARAVAFHRLDNGVELTAGPPEAIGDLPLGLGGGVLHCYRPFGGLRRVARFQRYPLGYLRGKRDSFSEDRDGEVWTGRSVAEARTSDSL